MRFSDFLMISIKERPPSYGVKEVSHSIKNRLQTRVPLVRKGHSNIEKKHSTRKKHPNKTLEYADKYTYINQETENRNGLIATSSLHYRESNFKISEKFP